MFERYFTEFYSAVDLDSQGIVRLLKVDDPRTLAVQFRSAAQAFRLIDDQDQAAVVVRYAAHHAAIEKLLDTLSAQGPQRWLMRKLQRYTITIPQRQATQMLERGALTLPMPGLYVLIDSDNLYSSILGLLGDADLYNPSEFAL